MNNRYSANSSKYNPGAIRAQLEKMPPEVLPFSRLALGYSVPEADNSDRFIAPQASLDHSGQNAENREWDDALLDAAPRKKPRQEEPPKCVCNLNLACRAKQHLVD